jgi:very-short-patch-repair endonuclease
VAGDIDRAIAALAGRQRGFVTRVQLLLIGLGPGAIDYRIRRGWLIPVYTGVYAVGHRPISPIDRAAAAVLACGDGAVLSHSSAAALWGFVKRWRMPFETTARHALRRSGICVHRSRALTHADIRILLGIRVTSPARTVLDVAPTLDAKALTRMVNEGLLSNYLRHAALAELLDRQPRHPGAKRLRAFVESAAGPTRSQLEDEFLAFTRRFGLPRPEMNVRVAGYEVDALFRAERVIVELDGYSFHSSRAAFERERERDANMLAAGFETLRATWERLRRAPVREADRLQRILEARREGHGGRAG